MTIAPVYVVFVVAIGFAGAFFHELVDRATRQTPIPFWRRILYRTLSWVCPGLGAILLSSALNLP